MLVEAAEILRRQKAVQRIDCPVSWVKTSVGGDIKKPEPEDLLKRRRFLTFLVLFESF